MIPWEHIHVVALRAPLPLNNAIAIDLYHFTQKLHEEGLKITFHLLQETPLPEEPEGIQMKYYRPGKEPPYTYRRNRYHQSPLIKNLAQDEAPVVFSGIRTAVYLDHVSLRSRRRIMRIHRVEKADYRALLHSTGNLFRKLRYRNTMRLMRKFEKQAAKADLMVCTSERDTKYYARLNSNAYFLPAFHAYTRPNFMPGLGRYALYFGDLSSNDNAQAVYFLLDKVFPRLRVPVIIAGRNPLPGIKTRAQRYKHVILRANPESREMHDVIANAQVAVLPTFRDTGLKMQFLIALYRSRHVLVNTPMIEHTGLESLCTVKNQPVAMANTIHRLFKVPFDKTIKAKRRKLFLPHYYSPDKNIRFFLNLMKRTH